MCYIAAMIITDALVSNVWLWMGFGLYAYLLFAAVRSAAWSSLQKSERLHVYLGSCVALMILWTVKAGIHPGLSFHYLGATLFTLMFGWQLALIGFSLVLAGTTINLGSGWEGFAITLLCKGGLPILLSHGLHRLFQEKLPAHVFIYIFLNAFLTSALAILASSLAVATVLGAAGAYTSQYLLSEYLAFAPLMMFSEAWLTGMLIAGLVGYRPGWLTTFEDSRYLHGK